MTSIAELGIAIDSRDAVQAAADLDKLADAGQRSEASAGKTGRAWESALGNLQGDTRQIVVELQALNAQQAELAQQMITVGRAVTTALTAFRSGAEQASQAQASLASATDDAAQAGQRLSETAEEQSARMAAVVKSSLEASEYHQRLAASVTDTSEAMDTAGKAATDWAAYQQQINARGQTLLATEQRLAEESRKAAGATDLQADALETLLGKINPTIVALDRLDQQQAQLQKYKNAGLLDAETFSEYTGRIDASRHKLGDFDDSLQKTTASSKRTETALRQLPGQFSDIFNSLIGGQNPLMVLIQQGGQIADSFGGVGPTLDVLGGKMRSMLGLGDVIGNALETVGTGAQAAAEGAEVAGDSLGGMAEGANTAADAAKNAKEATTALGAATPPLTLGMGAVIAGAVGIAAALTALIYGYSQGSKEADRFNKTLILTGNYAGTTAAQLADMATRVGAINGTVGEAAATLTLLAGSGKVATGSFELVANAALVMEDATGRAVKDTVAEFVKIGDDPVQAAKSLNEQYHFLTASVYAQVVALKEQGDTIGAAKLLTDTYAQTIQERAGQIASNLGVIERGWKGVKDAANAALDATLGIGRETTLGDQIKSLENRLATPGAYSAIPIMGADNPNLMEVGNTRAEDEERLRTLKLYNEEQIRTAKLTGDRQKVQEASILAQDKLNDSLKATDSNQKKLRDRLAEIDELASKSASVDGGRAYTAAELNQLREAAKKQFADPAKSATAVDLSAFNDAQNRLKAISGYYDNIQRELDAAQKAGLVSAESYASQRVAVVEQETVEVTAAYEAEIAALEAVKAKGTTSAEQRIQLDQKIADARASMVKAQQDAETELQVLAANEHGRLNKQTLAVQAYTDALQQQVTTLQNQGQRAADSLGMGDRQRSLFESQNAIDDRVDQQRVELASQYGDGSRGMSLDEYQQKLAALNTTQKDLRDTVQSNYDDMTVAQGSWSAGASSAFQNYLDSARDVAGQTKSLFTSAFSSMEDAVVNFAMTGKFSFADFTKSILADMARIAARQAASSLLSSLVGWGASAVGGYFGGGGSAGSTPEGYSSDVIDGWSGIQQAKGGAWNSGVQMFANGAAFTNSIVSQPTEFDMAGGQTGVMGEAGPEAVMPLTRTPGGQLGVRALGAGGGTAISISVPVSIVTEDRSGEGMQIDQQALQLNLQTQMKSIAEKAVADSWRAGGASFRQMRNA